MRDNDCVPFFVFSCRFIDFASATGYRRGEENDGQEVGALLHVLAATGGEINGRHHHGSVGRTQDYGYVTKQPWDSGASYSLLSVRGQTQGPLYKIKAPLGIMRSSFYIPLVFILFPILGLVIGSILGDQISIPSSQPPFWDLSNIADGYEAGGVLGLRASIIFAILVVIKRIYNDRKGPI